MLEILLCNFFHRNYHYSYFFFGRQTSWR